MKPDSGYAWLVLVAAHVTNFVSIGFLYSVIGLLIPEYNEHFHVETTQSSWIGSVLTGFVLLGGPFAAFIISKLSCRKVAVVAMLVLLSAFIASGFVTKIWHVIVTFGVFSVKLVIILGIIPNPLSAAAAAPVKVDTIQKNFQSLHISFPFIARYILDALPYNYSILSLAAIVSLGLPCAFMFKKPNFSNNEQDVEVELKQLASEPTESDIHAEPATGDGPVDPEPLTENNHTDPDAVTENGNLDPEAFNLLPNGSNNNNLTEPSKLNDTDIEDSVSVKRKLCCDPKELLSMVLILKRPVIVVFLINAFLFNVSGGIMSVLAYDFYEKSGFNATHASLGYSFYGGGSLIGSLLLALIAAFMTTNGLAVHIISNTILAITQLVFPFLNFDHRLLSLFLSAFGLGYGLICANLGSMIDHINGDYMLSMVYGYEMAAAGLGNLVGPVAAAYIQSVFGNQIGFVFGSCCSFLALGILVVYCLFHRNIYIPLNLRTENSHPDK